VAQYTPSCVSNDVPATRSDAIACRNYLITAGSTPCDIPAADEYVALCTSGISEILGWNYYDVPGALLASCSDAAVGASWVIDNCSTCPADNCGVQGLFNWSFYVCKSALLKVSQDRKLRLGAMITSSTSSKARLLEARAGLSIASH
jgi:hypothetical protein